MTCRVPRPGRSGNTSTHCRAFQPLFRRACLLPGSRRPEIRFTPRTGRQQPRDLGRRHLGVMRPVRRFRQPLFPLFLFLPAACGSAGCPLIRACCAGRTFRTIRAFCAVLTPCTGCILPHYLTCRDIRGPHTGLILRHHPECQSRCSFRMGRIMPALAAPPGFHRQEGQRIGRIPGTGTTSTHEAKGSAQCRALLRRAKQVVHRTDHRR